MKIDIRKINEGERPLMQLLLLAAPSSEIVEEYVKRNECFIPPAC